MKTKVALSVSVIALLGLSVWVFYAVVASEPSAKVRHVATEVVDYVEPIEENADTNKIAFATVKGTERATAMLREKGLRSFMDEVWKQGVAAPGIHSKYWLDQFTRGKPKLHAIEKAYRDFGYEVAVQVEDLAFEIYEKPEKASEADRLDWLLKFSKWMLKPRRFENYRIGMRVEDAATMPLLRISFNVEIPIKDVELASARFLSVKENAIMRANILFEESDGVFDVRDLASKVKPGEDDGFEARWRTQFRRAYRYFGNRILDYTLDAEVLLEEEIENSFFMDDGNELGGRCCIAERWDDKLHRNVCIFGDRSYMMSTISGILTFRKDIGCFPEVKYATGTNGRDAYVQYYFKTFNWEKRLTKAPADTVGWLFWQYKTNTFMDKQTRYAYETRNSKRTSVDAFESWSSTKERRARNQQWLKKHRKAK